MQEKMGSYSLYGMNTSIYWPLSELVAQKCSVKKVFLEILQNSQENTDCRVSFLIKLQLYSKSL